MPPKGSKKGKGGKKTDSAENPPLPAEAPPLPDEAPPLPDEQPAVPTDAPPLPVEAPPLPDEAPPLPVGEDAPPLPDEAPPLPDEAPPLPDEQPPLPDEQPPLPNEPVTELGGSKEKDANPAHAWQAVWAPEKNAYYFWNTETNAVTWENPLAPASSSSTPAAGSTAASASATPGPSVPRGGLPDIDPELAYLLPSESRDAAGTQLLAVSGRFQQRDDGAFAARDEYERQKRFGDAYFDVEGWEKERGKRRREEEQPRKVTKKDMERFKAKKAEKTRRARAWLYD
ncbi:hypothetical protein A1Q2_07374 [Trichosporon asahii var. asahii CBS 8904]|uniref:WW domain-containing protein n=1 Tax=Trichosporon asahii var. asahii (strain CBS 8904) TaxID=1220162 RepID=K1VC16_TRIAC|nr:hypothetical protein A1Q2_07374 [Trichosporon asahii var. asahii CBS 8904]